MRRQKRFYSPRKGEVRNDRGKKRPKWLRQFKKTLKNLVKKYS